jgi:tellurite resistance protein TerC
VDVPISAWLVLAGVVAIGVTVDLYGHRGDHGLGRRAALLWSAAWIGLAAAFGGWMALALGHRAAVDFATGFLVEKSLSIDNLFVFMVIFARLGIPQSEQHRVLSWGILGAFLTRGIFIAAGAALLRSWHGVIYVLGAFLVFTAWKTLRDTGSTGEGKILPFLRRHLRFTAKRHGHHFMVVERGRHVATLLLLALIVIEISDVLFAVDSIPAVFAVTDDTFVVYSSNVFAILGLRALYHALADLLSGLKYLRYGLAGILTFTGAKMLASHFVELPAYVTLLVVVVILAAVVVPSLIARRRALTSSRARAAPRRTRAAATHTHRPAHPA